MFTICNCTRIENAFFCVVLDLSQDHIHSGHNGSTGVSHEPWPASGHKSTHKTSSNLHMTRSQFFNTTLTSAHDLY